MIRTRRTRIVGTLGPTSNTPELVLALARAGVDVFRLNFSHGSHDDHAKSYENVRAAEAATGRPLGILADLQGPKLRLGTFQETRVQLEADAVFTLDRDPTPGDATRCCLPHPEIFAALAVGEDLLIDDGKVRLRVVEHGPDWAKTKVIQPGPVSNRKGVNVPTAILPISAMTDKDRADLRFALKLGVDWVALSFVQRAADMAELRKLVNGKAACLAKIEKPAALEHLGEILDYCDGVMVARGDLGVELAPEDVPVAQKTILRAARERGVPTIVATQMLESMITAAAPTRAEASDVANAVYEGTDALMLSAETANGAFPIEAVTVMSRIAARVEADPRWPGLMDAEHSAPEIAVPDAVSAAARIAADASKAACLVAFTATGTTALRVARERPLQPILALSTDIRTARKLALLWGTEARVTADPKDIEDMAVVSSKLSSNLGLAKTGDRIVIVAGLPFGTKGGTNLMRIARAS
jgi:pyruvate kinase